MNFQMTGNNKMYSAAVVFILMIATLYIAIVTTSYDYDLREPILKEEFVLKVKENVAVTSVPEPNNEPAIAVDPNDPMHIVAAGNDYGTPNEDAWVGYYVSRDGGETWERDLIPGYWGGPLSILTGFDGTGDPVVCFGPEGNVYISGICFNRANNPAGFGYEPFRGDGIFVAKSTDGGETFDQISMLIFALQPLIAFHDKEWMAVDMNNGNVYVTWAVFTGLSRASILLSRSTDGGNSFSRPQVISNFLAREFDNQGTTIQVTPDGNVHVFWIDFGEGNSGDEQIIYIYSTDNGQSFSTPESISDVEEIPYALENGNYRTPTLLMSAVDLSDTNTSGSLYVTWNDYRYGDADILLIYSRDGGDSWSEPIRVNNDEEGNGHDQFFSAVAVSTQGWVHMVFYDRRDDKNNTLLWAYYALSKNGGENFTININVSDENFNGDYSRDSDNDFIGDYIGITATNTTAYAVWCDTREGRADEASSEIYFGAVEFSDGSDEQAS